MKIFLLFLSIFAISHQKNIQNVIKIASGSKAKAGDNLEFCWMEVTFQNKRQYCGCTLIHAEYVVTTFLCVYEYKL